MSLSCSNHHASNEIYSDEGWDLESENSTDDEEQVSTDEDDESEPSVSLLEQIERQEKLHQQQLQLIEKLQELEDTDWFIEFYNNEMKEMNNNNKDIQMNGEAEFDLDKLSYEAFQRLHILVDEAVAKQIQKQHQIKYDAIDLDINFAYEQLQLLIQNMMLQYPLDETDGHTYQQYFYNQLNLKLSSFLQEDVKNKITLNSTPAGIPSTTPAPLPSTIGVSSSRGSSSGANKRKRSDTKRVDTLNNSSVNNSSVNNSSASKTQSSKRTKQHSQEKQIVDVKSTTQPTIQPTKRRKIGSSTGSSTTVVRRMRKPKSTTASRETSSSSSTNDPTTNEQCFDESIVSKETPHPKRNNRGIFFWFLGYAKQALQQLRAQHIHHFSFDCEVDHYDLREDDSKQIVDQESWLKPRLLRPSSSEYSNKYSVPPSFFTNIESKLKKEIRTKRSLTRFDIVDINHIGLQRISYEHLVNQRINSTIQTAVNNMSFNLFAGYVWSRLSVVLSESEFLQFQKSLQELRHSDAKSENTQISFSFLNDLYEGKSRSVSSMFDASSVSLSDVHLSTESSSSCALTTCSTSSSVDDDFELISSILVGVFSSD